MLSLFPKTVQYSSIKYQALWISVSQGIFLRKLQLSLHSTEFRQKKKHFTIFGTDLFLFSNFMKSPILSAIFRGILSYAFWWPFQNTHPSSDIQKQWLKIFFKCIVLSDYTSIYSCPLGYWDKWRQFYKSLVPIQAFWSNFLSLPVSLFSIPASLPVALVLCWYYLLKNKKELFHLATVKGEQ